MKVFDSLGGLVKSGVSRIPRVLKILAVFLFITVGLPTIYGSLVTKGPSVSPRMIQKAPQYSNAAAQPAAQPFVQAQSSPICRAYHTVKAGETLYGIATRTYGVAFAAVLRANPQIQNPNYIRVGEQICIP